MSHLLCVYTFPLCVTPKDISVVTTGWTFFFFIFFKIKLMEICFCLEEEPEAKRRMKRGGNVLLHPSSPLLPLAFKKEKPRGYIRNHKKSRFGLFSVTGFLFLLLAVLLNIQKIKNIRVCFLLFKFFNSDLIYIHEMTQV